ncbi:MAG: Crp/Fnr family transcriptional regulator [Pedobacter sp.]|nr:MAG: Crp/Fnr family transcriptional regulator [Pedobacter sp.]
MNIKYLLDQQFSVQLYKKGETIYHPDTQPRAVYFIKTGKVKMVTVNNDGQEFIQGMFKANEYFGEPALLLDKPYLAYTIAIQDTEIIAVNKKEFFKFLESDSDFSMRLILTLSNRLFYKSMMLEELANEHADHRVKTLVIYLLKDVAPGQELNVTRQQMADMTGLRVETVIRLIKQPALQIGFKLIKGKIVKDVI